MRTKSHLLMTVVLLLAFAPARWEPWLYGIAGGVLVDLDHVYVFIRKFGVPRSRDELQKIMKEHFETKDESCMPRLRTILQEPFGFLVMSVVALLLHPVASTGWAIPALWGHFVLDAISVRTMPLEPFSRREIYIGWLDPTARPRRVFVFNMLLLIVAMCELVLWRADLMHILETLLHVT